MTYRYLLTTGLTMLICLGTVSPTIALTLFDVSFSDDTIGLQPAVTASVAGVVNTKPTTVNPAPPDTSILVQSTYTDSNTAEVLSSNVAVLTDSGEGGTTLAFKLNSADTVSAGMVSVAWTMLIETDSGFDASNFFIFMQGDSGEVGGGQFGFTGNDLFIRKRTASGTFAGLASVGSVGTGQVVQWQITLDYSAGTQTFKKDNIVVGTGSFASNLNFNTFTLRGGGASRGIVAVDNIIVTVPEPGLITISSLATLLLCARRQKRA